jgi:cytochrome c oxidase subunit 2
MIQILLMVSFGILGAIWTAIWVWVLVSARHPAPQVQVEAELPILRRRLLYISMALVVAIFLVSIYWLPYAFIRRGVDGQPVIKIQVLGQQWVWTFSQTEVPVNVPVEFDVTSGDVNHGFGIYDPEGHLIAQTQAMPGYTNRLIFTFEQPGDYIVRCLELCGTPHFLMASHITVVKQ